MSVCTAEVSNAWPRWKKPPFNGAYMMLWRIVRPPGNPNRRFLRRRVKTGEDLNTLSVMIGTM